MKTASKICNFIGIALVTAFAVKSGMDYARYSTVYNSAPFHALILVNAVYFLVPAAAVFILGIIIREKANKKGYAG